MSIPTYDFITKPEDDDNMVYDYGESRFIALVDSVKANAYVRLERDWGSKQNAQVYLDLVSKVIYEAILAFKDEKYYYQTLYYLSHSKQAKILLQKIFYDSVWYNRRDGGFMMAYNSGANLNQGKLIEFGIDKALSPIAKQMVKNTILGNRYLNVDINQKEIFASLTLLLDYLVSEGYITQDEADVVEESENLNDLPYTEDYQLLALENSRYLFTNIKSIKTYKENMRRFNAQGDW